MRMSARCSTQLLDDGGAAAARRRRRCPRGCSCWWCRGPGTISPWSSKATDIARVCGLAAVRRIERGILYTLELQCGR